MIIRASLALAVALTLSCGAASGQTCPPNTNAQPAFTASGSVFGRIASQWNQYFASKVDYSGGVLCNPTLSGTVVFPAIGPGQVLGNVGSSSSAAIGVNVSPLLDRNFGSTTNRILYRGVSGWEASSAQPIFDANFGTATGSVLARSVSGWIGAPLAPTNGISAALSGGSLALSWVGGTVSGATTWSSAHTFASSVLLSGLSSAHSDGYVCAVTATGLLTRSDYCGPTAPVLSPGAAGVGNVATWFNSGATVLADSGVALRPNALATGFSLGEQALFLAGSITGSGLGPYAEISIADAAQNLTAGTAIVGLRVDHNFGGVGTGAGNRTAMQSILVHHTAAAPGTDTNLKFYSAVFGQVYARVNDGGISGVPRGNYYGISGLAQSESGATYLQGVLNELDVAVQAGSSVSEKMILQLVTVNSDAVKGTDVDAGLLITSDSTTSVKLDYGIAFGKTGTKWPVDGTLIGSYATTDPRAAQLGVDLRGVTFSEFAFTSDGFAVTPVGGVLTTQVIPVAVIEPPTPPAGQFYLYMDTVDSALKAKGPSGAVTNLSSSIVSAAAPHVPTNAALAASSIAAYPAGLWRDDYASGRNAGPVFYQPSGSACSLNAGAGDGGSQVPASGGGCWLAAFGDAQINPRMWGAVGDTTTVDTTAVQAALTYAAANKAPLYLGGYNYRTAALSVGTATVVGTRKGSYRNGQQNDTLYCQSGFTPSTTNIAQYLTVTNSSRLSDMCINMAGPGTNTSGVAISADECADGACADSFNNVVDHVLINGACIGVSYSGNFNVVGNSQFGNATGAGCGNIRVGYKSNSGRTVDSRIQNNSLYTNYGAQADYNILVLDAGGLFITNNEVAAAKKGLKVLPALDAVSSGSQNVQALTSLANYYDTSGENGIYLDCGTNSVGMTLGATTFTNDWVASSGGDAVSINATGGAGGCRLQGITFDGMRVIGNTGKAFAFNTQYALDVKVRGSRLCGNDNAAAGIFLASGVSTSGHGYAITDNLIAGDCDGRSGTLATGISLAGSNSDIVISGNNIQATTAVSGTPLGNSAVVGNKGLTSEVGTVASASTITLSNPISTWHVTGTTGVSTINGAWNGRAVTIVTVDGAITFGVGANICSPGLVSTRYVPITATYDGTFGCWLLQGTYNLTAPVGIGTMQPQVKLAVTGASEAFTGAGNEGIVQFTTGTGANTDNKLQFGIVDGSYVWLQGIKPGTQNLDLVLNPNGGNAGIGLLSPNTLLSLAVSGTTRSGGQLAAGQANAAHTFEWGVVTTDDGVSNLRAAIALNTTVGTGGSDSTIQFITNKYGVDRAARLTIGKDGVLTLHAASYANCSSLSTVAGVLTCVP